jgi:hypothetical protein
MSLEVLKTYGFQRVGHWELADYKSTTHLSHLRGVQFILNETFPDRGGVVYAFVIDQDVAYIGETYKGMRDRFVSYRYGNPLERDTDDRIKIELTEALLRASEVSVWAMAPRTTISLGAQVLEVSASKPVEELLIRTINPPLNRKRI